MTSIEATPGYRMNVLIRRRAGVTRDELVANWFANHMPAVVRGMAAQALVGRPHAHRYIATLFDAEVPGSSAWDGIAQLWWKQNPPRPEAPHGTKPADTFQQKAEPYMPWMVREYVVMDGSERLPQTPNTLNDPFPFTRSGFFKVAILLKAKNGADCGAFFRHWLEVHAPNVQSAMTAVGGFRYVIAHSTEPAAEEFAGMAELYFPNAEAWARLRQIAKPDGMERWADPAGTLVYTGSTEMVGIPG